MSRDSGLAFVAGGMTFMLIRDCMYDNPSQRIFDDAATHGLGRATSADQENSGIRARDQVFYSASRGHLLSLSGVRHNPLMVHKAPSTSKSCQHGHLWR